MVNYDLFFSFSDLKNCIINPTSRHSALFIGDPTLQQYYSALSQQLQESEAFSITENTDNVRITSEMASGVWY